MERVWPANGAARPQPTAALRATRVGGPRRDLAGLEVQGAAKGGAGAGLRDTNVRLDPCVLDVACFVVCYLLPLDHMLPKHPPVYLQHFLWPTYVR